MQSGNIQLLGKGRRAGMVNVMYASDLDNTLIFSKDSANTSICDTYKNGAHSYISNRVKEELIKLDTDTRVQFIPVTSRSLEEYNRVNLGIVPDYAIVANGGMILYQGSPILEWEEYVKRFNVQMDMIDIMHTVEDYFDDISSLRVVDNKYVFFKVQNIYEFDKNVDYLEQLFNKWTFTRIKNKVYCIPNHFSKQIALRWLWHKLNKPYIIASGDSILDLPMLTLANEAIIPSGSSLITDGYVVDATTTPGGVKGPLFTIDRVLKKVKEYD